MACSVLVASRNGFQSVERVIGELNEARLEDVEMANSCARQASVGRKHEMFGTDRNSGEGKPGRGADSGCYGWC
jgi:hypothetical protein